jgi:hypothetical protein
MALKARFDEVHGTQVRGMAMRMVVRMPRVNLHGAV